jgi:hypothetical protein
MEKLYSRNLSDEILNVITEYINLLGYDVMYMNVEERSENEWI